MTLSFDVRRRTARVRPTHALGWSLDGGDAGQSDALLDPRNRARLKSAIGDGPVSYRLRTELAGEAWHWSAYGRWSDPSRRQGYWTGDARRRDRAAVSYGFRLPRRGNSRDEANDDGYSRLDDGDPATFWKSNPYLDRPSDPPGAKRPEWIKIDLGAAKPVDGLEMIWRDPYARHLRVQFWRGENETGRWITFPSGDVSVSGSGRLSLRLAPAPEPVRHVRLLMDGSSGTAPAGATDWRDARGFAVAEIRLGAWRGAELADVIDHAPHADRQTRMDVSSTDPWHRAQDRDLRTEQPSPLHLLRLGLLPPSRTMLPVGVLYGTPEDAAAEIAYFRRFGLRPREIELGEEPEGQRTDPEVFAALYAQVARALERSGPHAPRVGPSLINVLADTTLDDDPEHSWTRRMMRALGREAPARPLQGFTLEHYPDDDMCADVPARLRREPAVMAALFERLRHRDEVPARTPIALSEIGQSAFSGQADAEIESGLFAAEVLAEFFSRGGSSAYLYAVTPVAFSPAPEACAGSGDMTPYQIDPTGFARWPMPELAAYRLVGRTWLGAASDLYAPAASTAAETPLGYAAHRSDGRWSVLLVNPGPRAQAVRLRFGSGGPLPERRVELWRYGPDQYAWSAALQRPLHTAPPSRTPGGRWRDTLALPPRSITVARTL